MYELIHSALLSIPLVFFDDVHDAIRRHVHMRLVHVRNRHAAETFASVHGVDKRNVSRRANVSNIANIANIGDV